MLKVKMNRSEIYELILFHKKRIGYLCVALIGLYVIQNSYSMGWTSVKKRHTVVSTYAGQRTQSVESYPTEEFWFSVVNWQAVGGFLFFIGLFWGLSPLNLAGPKKEID